MLCVKATMVVSSGAKLVRVELSAMSEVEGWRKERRIFEWVSGAE